MTGDLWMPGGLKVRILLDGAATGWELPTHRHEGESETVTHIPRGVPHGGRALGEEAGKRVVVFSPATEHGWRC
ncbi:MAG: hypothetical protein ACSLFR_01655 [Solirubrobacteraceae bacterium]